MQLGRACFHIGQAVRSPSAGSVSARPFDLTRRLANPITSFSPAEEKSHLLLSPAIRFWNRSVRQVLVVDYRRREKVYQPETTEVELSCKTRAVDSYTQSTDTSVRKYVYRGLGMEQGTYSSRSHQEIDDGLPMI